MKFLGIFFVLIISNPVFAVELFSYKESSSRIHPEKGIHPITLSIVPKKLLAGDTLEIKAPSGEVVQYLVEKSELTGLGNWLVTAKVVDEFSRLQLVIGEKGDLLGDFNILDRKYKIDSANGSLQIIDILSTGAKLLPIDHGALVPPGIGALVPPGIKGIKKKVR